MANSHNMRLWIEALRSGKFRQGHGALKVTVEGTDLYCCLGVACEVAIASGLDLAVARLDTGAGVEWEFGSHMEKALLPPEVRKWLDIISSNPALYTSEGGKVPATRANDSEHWTFEQIADGLEAAYLPKEGN